MTCKGGVHAPTGSMANELGDDGITVNSIAPTVVMTEGYAERMPTGGPTASDMMPTSCRSRRSSRQPGLVLAGTVSGPRRW
jgi:NAD(P)-dependent dehydrogenase (short-subunit alcohol dehydrogenase family)